MPNAQTLQAVVMAELEWEPSLDAAHIGVTAKQGVVTLTGFVDSCASKGAAEPAAARVQGVKAIAEEIEVRDPDHVQQRIKNALLRNAEVEASGIDVSVDGGKVTLRGQVRTWFERSVAKHAA